MTEDQKRGQYLAELARHFILWLQHNDLPGVPGLREFTAGPDINDPARTFDLFFFYAGIYQRFSEGGMRVLTPTFLREAPTEDLERMKRLSLGPRHFLMSKNDGEVPVVTIKGEGIYCNRILRDHKIPFDREKALVTIAPRLDSLKADTQTLNVWANRDFCTITHKIDLVWDDQETAARARFRYLSLLDQTQTPRKEYESNVEKVLPPERIYLLGNKDLRDQNSGSQIIAKRTRHFRQYLLDYATYRNKHPNFGDYYRKWESETPLRKDQRQFRPSLLRVKYLQAAFRENKLKTNDYVLLIDLGRAFFLYRLFWDRQKWMPGARFMVEPLVQSVSEDIPQWPPKYDPKQDEDPWWLAGGVDAYVFHVASGDDKRPNQQERSVLQGSQFPVRFIVAYHAFVRWYYGDQLPQGLKSDRQFFDRFVKTFFPDQTYVYELNSLNVSGDMREKLFLAELRRNMEASPAGPLKDYLEKLVKWCDDNPRRFVLTQGMFHGGGPRQFIGISGTPPDVFEWNTETGLVTRIRLSTWLEQFPLAEITHLIYQNTNGVMGLVALVFAAGVAPIAAVALPQQALGMIGRHLIKDLVVTQAGKQIAKDVARKAAPQIIGIVVQGVMRLLPSSDNNYYRFMKGFSEGLGTSAVQHYLSGIDKRLEKQINKIPAAIAYKVSPKAYRAYQAYTVADKLTAAGIRLAKLYDAWRSVSVADLPQRFAKQLNRVNEAVGTAFLVILIVAVYFIEMSESNSDAQRQMIRVWVDHQKNALKFMVTETAQEVKNYAGKLRELVQVKGSSEVISEDLGPHDEELAKAIKAKLIQGATKVTGIADLLALLLDEMGVDNWEELKKLGFRELMSRGWDAMPPEFLKPDAIEKLGKAIGELFSTIMMERKIVPKNIRRTSGPLLGKPTSNFLKAGLADGTCRTLLRVLVQPFEKIDIARLPDKLRTAIEKSSERFEPVRDETTSYRNFQQDLLGYDENLAKRLVMLAENDRLVADLETLITSALATEKPPALKELKGDDVEWPAHAIAFVLNSWLRVGLKELGKIFTIIEDKMEFAGKFSVSEVLSILGLDVPLDDETVEGMRAVFPFPKQAESGS